MHNLTLHDIVQLRKKHPCGSDLWKIDRLGTDIGLLCQGCQRRILIPRSQLNRQLKKHLPHPEQSDD